MPADEHYALWVNPHGKHCWEGPFGSAGRAWGHLQGITGTQAFVVHVTEKASVQLPGGTQMSNAVPAAPAAPDNEFATAQPAESGYGPWFTATYDSDCDGICGGRIYEGEQSRSDGQGGWLCSFCGKDE